MGSCPDSTTSNSTMMKITIALLACMIVAASASASASAPRFQKLEKLEPKLGCSITEILACAEEIDAITNDCGHLTTAVEIQTCINDVLGATDCNTCICDILGC